MAQEKYRALFLSDTHLGWSKSHCGDAALLLDALKCDTLYLAGDIFDGWKLRRRWFWDEDHDLFLSAVLRKADEGTKIIIMPGNHDETLRNPALKKSLTKIFNRHGLHFCADALHKTANGRTIKVLHGDQFDDWFLRSFSQGADDVFNGGAEQILGKGRPKKVAKRGAFSLGKYFRKIAKGAATGNSKSAKSYIESMHKKAQDMEVDGIIMGHTHMPFNSDDNKDGKHASYYGNCGDWTHSFTVLAETKKGRFKIVNFEDVVKYSYYEERKKLKKKGKLDIHPKAAILKRWVHRLWSPKGHKSSDVQPSRYG